MRKRAIFPYVRFCRSEWTPITRMMRGGARMINIIRAMSWFGAVVYQSRRQQHQGIEPGPSNVAFGQSVVQKHICWVVVNGKKVKIMLDSWELLVATLVVLTFFMNMARVPSSHAHVAVLRSVSAMHQASSSGMGMQAIDETTSHHLCMLGVFCAIRNSSVPTKHGMNQISGATDLAFRTDASIPVALEIARSQWLAQSTAISINANISTSENTSNNVSSSDGKPNFYRLS